MDGAKGDVEEGKGGIVSGGNEDPWDEDGAKRNWDFGGVWGGRYW